MKPKFFSKPELFRKWLEKNHNNKEELWVGYYKKATGKPSIDWSESVDQALCYGWIDGLRRSIDEECYMIRFTPRKANSHWSRVNINKVKELKKLGLMKDPGLEAFKKMKKDNSEQASFEQKKVTMPKKYLELFKKNKKAWAYYQKETPSYRKQTTWWIISAKQEATRQKRLQTLISDSENHQWIKALRWTRKKST